MGNTNVVETQEPEQGELDAYDKTKLAISDRGNRRVTRPIPRISRDIIPRKGQSGGPTKKHTPTTMVNGVNRYFAWCENKDEVPTIKGMMIHLKYFPKTFYKLIADPEYSEIMEWARMLIKSWMEIDVYNTPGPAAGKITYMKNTHDWSEKISTENKTEVTQVMTTDEARIQLQALAPLLIDLVQKDQTVVEQIGNVQDAEIIDEPVRVK